MTAGNGTGSLLNGTQTAIGKKSNKTQIKTLEILFANGSDNGPFYCYGDNIVGKVTKIVNVTIHGECSRGSPLARHSGCRFPPAAFASDS